ncbi:MAG: CcdB family protein, partial [Proteobacteria bacterium]|nr:CcdB family protein [Pseudomonadota bacterium]
PEPSGGPTMQRLNPLITIEGREYFLSTTEMASIPVRELASRCGNLVKHRGELLAAVDLLFTAV